MSTKIQWAEDVWNPIVGCSLVSPGCTNCYAMRAALRLSKNPATPHYHGTVEMVKGRPVWTGKVALAPERTLTEPLRRRKPTTYFVNSMGDLFHEDVPDEWIDRVIAVMALAPQHTFQVLTKRSARMRAYLAALTPEQLDKAVRQLSNARGKDVIRTSLLADLLPLPNVWLGVSAEDQRRADERVFELRHTPAAVRFVSAEPLLGPIDFTRLDDVGAVATDALRGVRLDPKTILHVPGDKPLAPLDWVIVGGESGPGARPCNVEWIRDIVRQCKAAAVPCFTKQLGSRPFEDLPSGLNPFNHMLDRKGGDMAEFPADLQVREMPR